MSPKPAHILIIEDNEDILLMLQTMLKMNGHTASVKKNTDNIYHAIRSLSPDLIIMDMLLSGADGRDICQQLKTNDSHADIPVIMMSAHPVAKHNCLAAGANYFIAKPFDMEEMLQTIASAVA